MIDWLTVYFLYLDCEGYLTNVSIKHILETIQNPASYFMEGTPDEVFLKR